MQDNTGLRIIEGGITAPKGFLAAAVAAGIKNGQATRNDVALLFSTAPATAAAVFTTNKVQAAPVLVSREHVKGGTARAVVVNSGNANACTGEIGLAAARRTAAVAAELLGIEPEEVLVASTGVIGVELPVDRVLDGVRRAAPLLSAASGAAAARAIMTTDTRPKSLAVEIDVEGVAVRIAGMAKGSGMIHPNMGTMLAFFTTDASVPADVLDAALREVVGRTFNMVTVDGDTSTNDTAAIIANGLAGNPPLSAGEPGYETFLAGLHAVALHLAKEVARDGEGAAKFVEVKVTGAASEADARAVAKAVAGSNLVKTAVFGADPNWGRIICAVGYSGVQVDVERIDISVCGCPVARDGAAYPFDEAALSASLQGPEVPITVDLKLGGYAATAWTCDLTYDYIKINASYRT